MGQCFVWADCVQGPMSSPRTDMSQLSCPEASPQSTVFEGHRQVHGACTPSGKMNVSVVAMPLRNH